MPAFVKAARYVLLPVCAVACSSCGDAGKRPATPPAQTAARPTELAAVDAFSGANAYVHCAALCDLGPRSTGSPAYAKQVAYLTEHLQKAGWQVRTENFAAKLFGNKMQNVHATYGRGEACRPLLITCHIDTKGQGSEAILGADDGASGAAVLLELARTLARTPELAARVELAFFDGEESFGKRMNSTDGLFGSRHDVERRGSALPLWMINLDMVGGAGKTIGVPVFDTSETMCAHYDQAIRTLGLPEDRWTYHFGSYLDDHIPFVNAGVHTLNLIAQFKDGNWWHTQRDDMSRISAASLEETGRVVQQLIRQLLAEPAAAK